MNSAQSFYEKVSRFFESYLSIPKNAYFYEQNEILTRDGIKYCANCLVYHGVFINANDMKTEALKEYHIILPDWVFEDLKRGDTE